MGKIVIAIIGALLAAAIIIIYSRNDPSTTLFYPKCVFHELTGINCPGCGAGRALYHLLHGRLVTAFFFNPLLMLCLPYFLYSGLSGLAAIFTPYRLPVFRVDARWTKWVPAIFIAYFIMRNIPIYPFTILAPHYVGF